MFFSKIMKIKNYRGVLTDILAKKEALRAMERFPGDGLEPFATPSPSRMEKGLHAKFVFKPCFSD